MRERFDVTERGRGMILKDVGMLVSPSIRTKAYLQVMAKNGYLPGSVTIMDDRNNFSNDFKKTSSFEFGDVFDPYKSILSTIEENNIPYEFCSMRDPNDPKITKMLQRKIEKYFIYSGPAGVILRKDILSTGKKIIHIHSGWIPKYKGSTTVYYSILTEGRCGATAFFINENIDSGKIIKREIFDKPQRGIDIDYYYDCSIKSTLLKNIIETYTRTGEFSTEEIAEKEEETYFIIHPVLKHLAILECQKEVNY